jgi:hypothetical protein
VASGLQAAFRLGLGHEIKHDGYRRIVRREIEVGTSRGVRLLGDCRVLGTLREANGAALRRANYLLGYAKRFKISQEFILAAVASRVKIHVGKRPTIRILERPIARRFAATSASIRPKSA